MTTETLIRELVGRAHPVRAMGRPLVRFAVWAAFALVWILAAIAAVGVRGDLATAARAPWFAAHVIVPLSVGLAASGAAFGASVPRHGRRRWTLILVAMVVSLALLVIGGAFSGDAGHVDVGVGRRCIRNLVAFSVPPGALLCLMLRRAAPLDRATVGMLAAIGTAALAQVGTRFVCHQDGALHILAWHYSVVFLLGAAGLVIGRALFR